MRCIVLLTALALASPAVSGQFGMELAITQQSPTEFSVGYGPRAELSDYWCAAGNFVTNTLALPDRTRVYRASPPPRGAGLGIAFSLDPNRSAGDTGTSTFGGPQDGSFSAGAAFAEFCSGRTFTR